jgi:septal ring factor EnvC (AmiA/AmiB activator)
VLTQQAPPPETPPQKPEDSAPAKTQTHQVKVWTNEDLIALRTPMDIYLLQKEAQAAGDAANSLMSCFAWNSPAVTPEETQKEIQDAQQAIHDNEEAIAQVKKELETGPDNLKARNEKELERLTSELKTSQDRLNALQEQLRAQTNQPAEEQAAPPAPQTLQ